MAADSRHALQRGAFSAASPLVADLLRADSRPMTPTLAAASETESQAKPVPFERYLDRDFAALEQEKIWRASWQFACRAEDIPEVGDRIPYDVGTDSYFIVRSGPQSFRAFYNSCLHRGTRLCDGQGSGDDIRCPFHAWTWSLDGGLKNVPSRWDFPQVEEDAYRLPEVKVAVWGGFVFVNPDPNAGPLVDALGVLPDHFDNWNPVRRFTAVHVRKKIRANWKLTIEAFLESYHVVETHSDALPFTGDASTQYDTWDDGVSHVSRLITPLGVPSPHLGDAASARDAAETTLRLFALSMGPDVPSPSFDPDAPIGREQIADWRRGILQAGLGVDLSASPDAELIDSVQYFMFPNFAPWYGEGLPLIYQFLPLGSDPEACVMSIRVTAPLPPGDGPAPPAAQIVDLDFDAPFSDVPQLGMLSHIFDQDMINLPKIQRGLRAARSDKAFATLGRYQEARIQLFHRHLEHVLGL